MPIDVTLSGFTRVALLFALLVAGMGPVPAATAADPIAAAAGTVAAHATPILVALRTTAGPQREGVAASGSTLNSLADSIGAMTASRLFDLPVEDGLAPVDGAQGAAGPIAVYRLTLPNETSAEAAIATLTADPAVVYAERDAVAHLVADPPTDPLYASQWGLAKIQAPGAWASTTGSSSVTIAVIDAGVDLGHEDLAGQLWVNPGEIAGNGFDDDNDGYVDDIHGWNIYGNNADLSDTTGHGTQVAGVIAAAANNGLGGAGVCWGCRLMIVKVTQPGGIANYSDIAAGIAYAAAKGAKVINLSLGGASDSATLRAAVAAASQTAVVVGGAGNDNASAPFYPAAYDDALAVAGTDASDVKTATSNYGAWVDVTAPGEAITTTLSGGGYGAASGTSVAAPFASGLAGLLRSQHPDWSAALVRAQIIHTAVSVDAANPTHIGDLGVGRLNADQAFSTAPLPELTLVSVQANGAPVGSLARGTTVTVTLTVRNTWGTAGQVTGQLLTTDPYVAVSVPSLSMGDLPSGTTSTASFRVTVSPTAPYGHSVAFTLSLSKPGGYTKSFPVSLDIEPGEVSVSGMITTNANWTRSHVYHVTGTVSVVAGVTLTIEAGTTIKFDAGKSLQIGGTLVATGTGDAPIRFTSALTNPYPRSWESIVFSSAQAGLFDGNSQYLGGSVIQHTIIEYGRSVEVSNSSPFVADNAISNMLTESTRVLNGTTDRNHPMYIGRNRISDGDIAIAASSDLYVVENDVERGSVEVFENSVPVYGFIADNNVIGHGHHSGMIVRGGNMEVVRNRIIGTEYGLWVGTEGRAYGNLIANVSAVGLSPMGTTDCYSNTVVGNEGAAASVDTYLTDVPSMHHNNIIPMPGQLALRSYVTQNAALPSNWWSTTDGGAIGALIYDGMDEFGLGIVSYPSPLTEPEPSAPAYVTSVAVGPDSTLGIQRGTFEVNFSRPMDTSIDPIVTFGRTPPYTAYPVMLQAAWDSDRIWRGYFDVSSLVPRGAYTVSVTTARGTDGVEIAPDTRFHVTIDYAGQITDQTAPRMIAVVAGAGPVGVSSVMGTWGGADPDSAITGYRYAIGTAPGTADVVSWTETPALWITRSGLGLTVGQTYWLSVQARNVGGLWSPVAMDSFTAGQPLYWIDLPLVRRQ